VQKLQLSDDTLEQVKLSNFTRLSILDIASATRLTSLELHTPKLEYIQIGGNTLDRLGEVVIVTKKKN
jgi:hypothetical protein